MQQRSQWLGDFLSRHRAAVWLAQAVLLVAVGFAIAWSVKRIPSGGNSNGENDSHTTVEASPQVWTCSMHPQIRRNGPGDCPICGMDLVPVKASTGGMRTVSISPAARELLRIETTPVERRTVAAEVRMVGKVEYDETRLARITAWVSGRLDRLYVDYTGIEVKQGDHLVYIYSEDLYAAQEELIQAIKYQRGDRSSSATSTVLAPLDLVASAREKLRLLGLSESQVQEIEQRGTPADHITIYSPIGGIVIEKLRQEGDRVRTGDQIYTVADLEHVWVKLDAYESDLQWLRYGQEVVFETEAYPGEAFPGRIAFIDPVLNQDTRTVKVRVNVANQEGRLKPEMFVRAVVRSRVASGGRVLAPDLAGKWISPMHPEVIRDEPGSCDICGMPLVRAETLGYVAAVSGDEGKPLVIPVTAALVTGTRAIVYVETPGMDEPTYEGREVVLGPRAGGFYLVRSGLEAGEIVVTNGNFKLDSALQIAAKPSMMTPTGGGGGGHGHGAPRGSGDSRHPEASLIGTPPQFRSALEQLAAAFDRVAAAVEQADVASSHEAFNRFERAMVYAESKANALSEHAAVQWNELSMLIRNDVVEGKGADTLDAIVEAHAQLAEHMRRVGDAFGIGHGDASPKAVHFEVPVAFQHELSRLWDVYHPIGQALASDDFAAARERVAVLKPTLEALDTGALSGRAAEAWEQEIANLEMIADTLTEATEMRAARAAFALLSDELITLVSLFGISDVGEIFELHCPMAFEGRGASWLQRDDQPRNPYFGATMLKCADRIERVWPREGSIGPSGQHERHGGDHSH